MNAVLKQCGTVAVEGVKVIGVVGGTFAAALVGLHLGTKVAELATSGIDASIGAVGVGGAAVVSTARGLFSRKEKAAA